MQSTAAISEDIPDGMLVEGAEVWTLVLSTHVKVSALPSWRNSACHGAAINTMLRLCPAVCCRLPCRTSLRRQLPSAETMQAVVHSGA